MRRLLGDADTIVAPATPAGAALAIIRLSGPAAGPAAAALAGTLPAPRRAVLRRLQAPGATGSGLDQALLLWFPGPASATGEDVAEFQVHGGRAVVDAVLAALLATGQVRLARAGEFTRRAVLNGRLDLVQAEAVGSLVEAVTDTQREVALAQLEGGLSAHVLGWRERLVRLLADAEAALDFADEALPAALEAALIAEIAALAEEIGGAAADRRGLRLRDGLSVVLVGAPNAGKSSLFNALVGRAAAIVTPIAGTTRDMLEAVIALDGVPVRLVDTAGLRPSEDVVEAEGVRRAVAAAQAADVVLALFSAHASFQQDGEAEAVATLLATLPPERVLRLASRADEAGPMQGMDGSDLEHFSIKRTPVDRKKMRRNKNLEFRSDSIRSELALVPISTVGAPGLEALHAALRARIGSFTNADSGTLLTTARQRAAASEAGAALHLARAAPLPELRAEALRQALGALERLLGRVDEEAVLDQIFSTFCIGK